MRPLAVLPCVPGGADPGALDRERVLDRHEEALQVERADVESAVRS